MKQPGKIAIKDNKVYFEPDGLEKPKKDEFHSLNPWYQRYINDMKEYEASKQLVEVRNVFKLWGTLSPDGKTNLKEVWMMNNKTEYKNNQPCEAEVENNKAVITKIN